MQIFARYHVSKTTGTLVGGPFTVTPPFASSFVPVTAMNPADQKEFVVSIGIPGSGGAVSGLARTTNRGATYGTVATPLAQSIQSMVYSANGSELFVVSGSGVLRCSLPGLSCGLIGSPPGSGGFNRVIAVDPVNSTNLYVMQVTSTFSRQDPTLFYSDNQGTDWVDITVSGSLLDTAPRGGALAIIYSGGVKEVVVGTSNGILVPDGGLGVGWKVLADGIPKVVVQELVYDATSDVLVVATLGRGVWFLPSASQVVSGAAPGVYIPQLPPPVNNVKLGPMPRVTNITLPPEG